jgi:hypothetical protein
MLFLQQGPAQTTNYMIAGYTVIFGVILFYVLSLYLRNRNLKRDLDTLQELENKTNS